MVDVIFVPIEAVHWDKYDIEIFRNGIFRVETPNRNKNMNERREEVELEFEIGLKSKINRPEDGPLRRKSQYLAQKNE